MNIDELKKGILADIVRIEYSVHGFRRMLEKGISRSDVRECILNGEIIEDYPLNDDALSEASLPACLMLGFRSIDNKPVHIVLGYNGAKILIITAYYPDSTHWLEDHKTRR